MSNLKSIEGFETSVSVDSPIRVLLVDDYDMVRVGLRSILSLHSDIAIVGEADDGEEAVGLCDCAKPDVVLMDLVMPLMGGAEATRLILQKMPDVKIIILSSFADEEQIQEALRAGAISYILKNTSCMELADTIRRAFQGQSTLAPEVARTLIEATMRPPTIGHDLTQRELEVLKFMAHGMNNDTIASQLTLSPLTIKNHVSNILTKLGTSSRTQAVALAIENQIVSL